jgi:hypothetical protein
LPLMLAHCGYETELPEEPPLQKHFSAASRDQHPSNNACMTSFPLF